MNNFHINLLQSKESVPSYQTYRSPFAPLLISCCIFFLILGATAAFSYQNTKDTDSPLSKTWHSLIQLPPLKGFAENANADMGTTQDRINILLLGVGGGDHEGPQLTDTMILVSIKPSTAKVALFSIPRDLLVTIDGYGLRKINDANAFGETASPGTGGELAMKTVSETFDIPIQYYFRIDFQAFVDLVNTLGGVGVTVDQPFTDYTYPTPDKKVETISFEAGRQTMDGERALIFARSRHSLNNNEGSDFARSRRQQKILLALKEKLFSSTLLLRPQKIGDIISSLKQNISTNLQTWQMLSLGIALKKVDANSIMNTVFDDSEHGYLVSAVSSEGAYILKPRNGSFSEMQDKIKTIFDDIPLDTDHNIGNHIRVTIKNGTHVEGLASATASLLKGYEYTIASVSNATMRDYQKTAVYDFTNGKQKRALEFLKKTFDADVVYDPYSPELPDTGSTDLLIILGAHIPETLQKKLPLTTSPTETTPPVQ